MGSERLDFVKGHGTENDFVLLPDAADAVELTADLARALCDRHAGIGADGVIRIGPGPVGSDVRWLMDYRNADGSPAEMCGNGARVFARYLVDSGWAPCGTIAFATRGGPRWAEVGTSGDVTIGMGPVRSGARLDATVGGRQVSGLAVDVGNPHLACVVGSNPEVFDLTAPPAIDVAAFPAGANVEIVQVLAPEHVRMRVYERGVGETRSCGTGTVAAAAACLAAQGRDRGTVRVDVPGGTVSVTLAADTVARTATLTGPAVLLATGTVDLGALGMAR